MSRAMKSALLTSRAWAGAAALLLLAACSGGSDSGSSQGAPSIEVTELPAGTYAVSMGDAANPTAGKYYAAADGSRLLVLNDGAQQAAAMYRRDGNAGWQSFPAATQDVKVTLLDSSATPSNAVSPASVAGRYAVRLAQGGVAAFSVTASGNIVAGDTACKVSGTLAAGTLPNALKLALATAGCSGLPAQSDGYLVVDGDYAPAGFRLLAGGNPAPVDLWAYPE
jgi:hypothetical protein